MFFPKTWVKVSAPDKPAYAVWGWGEDVATARREGEARLQRLLARVARGEPFPDKYAYGARPMREEILEQVGGTDGVDAAAVVTRNAYGAKVLNTPRVLFLDIDDDGALKKTRKHLTSYGRATFRIYQTAAGYRVMAIDREFEPGGPEAQELMKVTETDEQFAQLCRAQKSFRARLTPKPWRCGGSGPPGDYPREDSGTQQAFRDWLAEYEQNCRGYATCKYLETVGSANPSGPARYVVDLHDRTTRAMEKLPLA